MSTSAVAAGLYEAAEACAPDQAALKARLIQAADTIEDMDTLIEQALDLIPRMSEDDPIAPALAAWCRRAQHECVARGPTAGSIADVPKVRQLQHTVATVARSDERATSVEGREYLREITVRPLIRPDMPIDERTFAEWRLAHFRALTAWYAATRGIPHPTTPTQRTRIVMREDYQQYLSIQWDQQVAQEQRIVSEALICAANMESRS